MMERTEPRERREHRKTENAKNAENADNTKDTKPTNHPKRYALLTLLMRFGNMFFQANFGGATMPSISLAARPITSSSQKDLNALDKLIFSKQG